MRSKERNGKEQEDKQPRPNGTGWFTAAEAVQEGPPPAPAPPPAEGRRSYSSQTPGGAPMTRRKFRPLQRSTGEGLHPPSAEQAPVTTDEAPAAD